MRDELVFGVVRTRSKGPVDLEVIGSPAPTQRMVVSDEGVSVKGDSTPLKTLQPRNEALDSVRMSTPGTPWTDVLAYSEEMDQNEQKDLQAAMKRIESATGKHRQQFHDQCYIFSVMRCLLDIQNELKADGSHILSDSCEGLFARLTTQTWENSPQSNSDYKDLYMQIYHSYFYETPWHQDKMKTVQRGSSGRMLYAMMRANCFEKRMNVYLAGDEILGYGKKAMGTQHLQIPYHALFYEFHPDKPQDLPATAADMIDNLDTYFRQMTESLRDWCHLHLLGGVFAVTYVGASQYDHYYSFYGENVYNDGKVVADLAKDTREKNGQGEMVQGKCADVLFFFSLRRSGPMHVPSGRRFTLRPGEVSILN